MTNAPESDLPAGALGSSPLARRCSSERSQRQASGCKSQGERALPNCVIPDAAAQRPRSGISSAPPVKADPGQPLRGFRDDMAG